MRELLSGFPQPPMLLAGLLMASSSRNKNAAPATTAITIPMLYLNISVHFRTISSWKIAIFRKAQLLAENTFTFWMLYMKLG